MLISKKDPDFGNVYYHEIEVELRNVYFSE